MPWKWEYSLRVFEFWTDQVGRQRKMFHICLQRYILSIALSHRQLKRSFLQSGKANTREPAMFQIRVIKIIIIFLSSFSSMLSILVLLKSSFLTNAGNSYTVYFYELKGYQKAVFVKRPSDESLWRWSTFAETIL